MTRRTNRGRWAAGSAAVALVLVPTLAAVLAFLVVMGLVPDDDVPPAHWTSAGSP
jgi:hypothetical protein